mmetsp:Transcript_38194/g.80082  ORF Transcript_38194/g.80082 Transcript_38194/m.80082 type:complete len:383 (-) Transcript_38194:288-1436(-)
MSVYEPSSTIFLRPEEFCQDEQNRLGRANGNTYRRKPGIPDVHDGQIMVRLKKKRFIILDYGYIPNEHDAEIARSVPHISIPNGAGTCKCATKHCPRIGVPVLMYDSEPNEPMSLYLRGGLCFSCQRNLNEKRRTQRKRKSDGHPVGEVRIGNGDMPSIGSGSGNGNRFKFNDQIVELNPDAVVINGPVDGTRIRGPDYRCPEIGSDLLRIVSELSHETLSLMQHSSAQAGMAQPVATTTSSVDAMYQKAFESVSKATFLLTQWKASWDENMVSQTAVNAAEEAAAASANFDSRILDEAVASQAALGGGANMAILQHNIPPQIDMGFPGHAQQGAVSSLAHAHVALDGGVPIQPLMMPDETNSNDHHIGGGLEERLEQRAEI